MLNSSTLIFGSLIFVSFGFFSGPSYAEINCKFLANQQVGNNPKERYKKGYCQVKLRRYQEGFNTLNSLQNALTPISHYVLYYQGVAQKQIGNSEMAKALFERVLNEYPSGGITKKVKSRVGDIYYEGGNYVEAENIYRSLFREEKDRQTKARYLLSIAEALGGAK